MSEKLQNDSWLDEVIKLSPEDLHYLMLVNNVGVFTRDEIRQVIKKLSEKSKKKEEVGTVVINNTAPTTSIEQLHSLPKYKFPIDLNNFEYEIQELLALQFGDRHPLCIMKNGKKYELVFDTTERMIQEIK